MKTGQIFFWMQGKKTSCFNFAAFVNGYFELNSLKIFFDKLFNGVYIVARI